MHCSVCDKWLTSYYFWNRHFKSKIHLKNREKLQSSLLSKESYCIVCDRCVASHNWSRHVNSKKHERKTLTPSSPSGNALASTASLSTPTTDNFSSYQIIGDTVKKCPHSHESILEGCSYISKRESSPERDMFDSVKQKLFEEEEEQILKFASDNSQTLAVDWDWDMQIALEAANESTLES
jgi:hypothetical protein